MLLLEVATHDCTCLLAGGEVCAEFACRVDACSPLCRFLTPRLLRGGLLQRVEARVIAACDICPNLRLGGELLLLPVALELAQESALIC